MTGTAFLGCLIKLFTTFDIFLHILPSLWQLLVSFAIFWQLLPSFGTFLDFFSSNVGIFSRLSFHWTAFVFSLQALKLPTLALLKINEDPSPEDEL